MDPVAKIVPKFGQGPTVERDQRIVHQGMIDDVDRHGVTIHDGPEAC